MQGAGGTKGDPGQTIIPTAKLRIILGSVVAFLIVADQLTKLLVRESFYLGESVSVWGDLVRLTYIHNAAGAFGIGLGHPAVFFIASTIIAVILSINLYRHPDLHRWAVWGLSLVLAGAVGNLIDRIWLGAVVDFIDCEFFDLTIPSFVVWFIKFPGYTMSRWPIFNVADSSVTVGILVLILSTWLDPPPPHKIQT